MKLLHFKMMLLTVSLFTISDQAVAVQAVNELVEARQPDGTTIKLFIQGDELNRKFLNENGELMMVNSDGFYIKATDEFKQKLNKTDNIAYHTRVRRGPGLTTKHFPAEGKQRVLVILAEFSNCKFSMEDPKQYYYNMLNQEGFNEYGATGSAKDYYLNNSVGKFEPEFDVYGPTILPNPFEYYGENDVMGNEARAYEMIVQACQSLDEEIDFSLYDADGDGIIDNVYLYYAGYGEADGGGSLTVWPHANDIMNIAPRDYILDGVKLNHYACSNELQNRSKVPDGIGTFCHEFGHVLGLPDLYSTMSANSFTPLYWDVMALGSYNNSSRTPPNLSAHERYALDWLTPTLLEGGNVTLYPVQLSNEAYIINTENDCEFFILENRQLIDNDAYLPGHGMLVWHIDFDQRTWDYNVVNAYPLHQYVDLVEADDIQSMQTVSGDPFPGTANVTEFTFTSVPALQSWYKKDLHYGIYNIQETPEGNITFDVVKTENSGINSLIDNQILSISGNSVSSVLPDVKIYDILGCPVAEINGGSIYLDAGIYIAVSGSRNCKFHIP